MPVLGHSIKPIHNIFSSTYSNASYITCLQSKQIDYFSYVGLVLVQDLELELIGVEGK